MPPSRWNLGQFAPAIFVVAAVIAVTVFVMWGPPHAAHSGQPTSWQLVFNLGALILFLSLVVAVIPVARHDIDSDNAFVAGLVATAALVPTTVTEIATVAAYIAVGPGRPGARGPWLIWVHNLALLIGSLAGLLAWTVWSAYYRKLVTPNWQNASIYAQLAQRVTELRAAYEAHELSPTGPDADRARATIKHHLAHMEGELGLPGKRCGKCGLRWVLATGYISMWQHLHSSEEALILLESPEALVRDALHDAQRIQSSTIPGATQLVALLRHAAAIVAPASNWYFGHIPLPNPTLAPPPMPTSAVVAAVSTPAGESPGEPTTTVAVAADVLHGDPATSAANGNAGALSPGEAERRQARSVIFEVRRIVNEFRDTRWDALVRRRNHLLEAAVFTRITAYGLLGLAILVGVQNQTIVAVTVFYLVGALVGLFNRMQSASATSLAVEDYGLSTALLTETAPFSGLAAVGGVLITGLVGVALNHSGPGTTGTDLGSIFDLQKDQFGIVVAAIFGLTPSLLTANLQRATDQYKSDLKSTGPSTSTHTD